MNKTYLKFYRFLLSGLIFFLTFSVSAQYFTNEFHDLNDNQVPEGWEFYENLSQVSITDGKLIAYPTDASGYLGRQGTVADEVSSFTFNWDGNLDYTYFGMCNQLVIEFNTNEHFKIYHQTAEYNFGDEAKLFVYYNDGNGDVLQFEKSINLHYDTYNYSVNINDETINFIGDLSSTGSNLFNEQIAISGIVSGFQVQDITAVKYWVNTTTDNNNWLDNIEIIVNSGSNTIADGWTHINNDIAGSSFYEEGSTIQSSQIIEDWTFSSFNYDFRNVLSGNVQGDSKLEIIIVQNQVLYILDSEGNTILSKDISIADQKYAYATMLEDVDGDELLDIGVAYKLFPNYGQGKARIYNGIGDVLKEFTKQVNSDMMLEPITIIDNDIIMMENAGYGRDPRGFSRWNLSTTNEIWQYDVGPAAHGYSIADINNDGLFELAYSNATVHNGASGNGTTDGDNYTIIINENGNELLTQKYSEGDANGNLSDMFVKFEENSSFKIISFKKHGETYYHGTSRLHIRDTDGTVEHTFTGLQNATWIYGWADIDNDNIQEIITTNKNNSSNILYIFDEQLNVQQSLNMPGNDYYFRAIADVNGDGSDEVIVSSSSDQKVVAYNSSLNEVWSWTGQSLGDIQKLIVSDNNQNGKLDVCVLTENKIVMLTGNGSTSINEIEQPEVLIFPNPVSNTLNIINANTDNTIQIYGINGNKVFEGNATEKINVSTLSNGMYFIRFMDDNTVLNTYKFIKR